MSKDEYILHTIYQDNYVLTLWQKVSLNYTKYFDLEILIQSLLEVKKCRNKLLKSFIIITVLIYNWKTNMGVNK